MLVLLLLGGMPACGLRMQLLEIIHETGFHHVCLHSPIKRGWSLCSKSKVKKTDEQILLYIYIYITYTHILDISCIQTHMVIYKYIYIYIYLFIYLFVYLCCIFFLSARRYTFAGKALTL